MSQIIDYPRHAARAPIADQVPDFERLVGSAGWSRLARDIRQRFSEQPQPGRPIRYVGLMHTVQCSLLGLLLAQCCRLIGTPFAPWRGTRVPVAIRLVHGGKHAVIWEREYAYPSRTPVLVRSTKVSTPEGLLECVEHGLGMRLEVFERDGALHFRSRYYFWRLGGFYLRLPGLFSPGIAHVVHTDLGGGYFRFTMDFRHRWFGTLFHQDGLFQRMGGAA
jgi:hypothetical protein